MSRREGFAKGSSLIQVNDISISRPTPVGGAPEAALDGVCIRALVHAQIDRLVRAGHEDPGALLRLLTDISPFTTSHMLTVRLLPPRSAGEICGSIGAYSSSVRSLS